MKNELKAFLKKHKKEILIAGVGIAALITSYFIGKKVGYNECDRNVVGYVLQKKGRKLSHVYNVAKNSFGFEDKAVKIATKNYDYSFIHTALNGGIAELSDLGKLGEWICENYSPDAIVKLTGIILEGK